MHILCVGYGMAMYFQHCSSMYACMHRLFAGVASLGVYSYDTLLCCNYFSSTSAVSHTFSALCVYSKFGHHPHPLGNLCAKFRFFCGFHWWASPWRKISYSITHSITQLILCPGNRSLRFRISLLISTVTHHNLLTSAKSEHRNRPYETSLGVLTGHCDNITTDEHFISSLVQTQNKHQLDILLNSY